ncbi:MAG: hypothetical protein KAS48_06585, partial [Gammaproteobacteria bacterium]|nr:hypothetical protein [Gammaproteobacteria bacterium]
KYRNGFHLRSLWISLGVIRLRAKIFKCEAQNARKAPASLLTLLTCVHAGNSRLLRSFATKHDSRDGEGRIASGTAIELGILDSRYSFTTCSEVPRD